MRPRLPSRLEKPVAAEASLRAPESRMVNAAQGEGLSKKKQAKRFITPEMRPRPHSPPPPGTYSRSTLTYNPKTHAFTPNPAPSPEPLRLFTFHIVLDRLFGATQALGMLARMQLLKMLLQVSV